MNAKAKIVNAIHLARVGAVGISIVLSLTVTDSAVAKSPERVIAAGTADSPGALEGSVLEDRRDSYMNKFTSRCMDSSINGLQALECNWLEWQSWIRTPAHGSYILKNRSTGLCLDDSDQYHLRAIPCNATPFQLWNIYDRADGAVQITNEETGNCLDDSFEFGIRAIGCNGMGFQRWWPRYGA
nr:hypothetical protein KitaXyl93_23480 [Kitasatospora sp. Xyl93]